MSCLRTLVEPTLALAINGAECPATMLQSMKLARSEHFRATKVPFVTTSQPPPPPKRCVELCTEQFSAGGVLGAENAL